MMENTAIVLVKRKLFSTKLPLLVGEVRTEMIYSYQRHHGLPQ